VSARTACESGPEQELKLPFSNYERR